MDHGYEIRQIRYKNVIHLYNYANKTDCGISIPFQGRHLATIRNVNDLSSINCEKCMETLKRE